MEFGDQTFRYAFRTQTSERLTIFNERSTKMNQLEMVELEQLRTDLPDFRVGDTVKVHVKIVEGDKERTSPLRVW